MAEYTDSCEKGEMVPHPGTYRCTGTGEIWVADQDNIRFPPCETCKDGKCRWVPVSDAT